MRTVRERIDPRRLELINIIEERDTRRRRESDEKWRRELEIMFIVKSVFIQNRFRILIVGVNAAAGNFSGMTSEIDCGQEHNHEANLFVKYLYSNRFQKSVLGRISAIETTEA